MNTRRYKNLEQKVQKQKEHPYVKGQKAKLEEERDSQSDFQESLHRTAQFHLLNGESSAQYRKEFFDQIFIDLLNDLFSAWIHTPPEGQRQREYLYNSALALGSVKSWLLKAEQKGNNVNIILDQQAASRKQADLDKRRAAVDEEADDVYGASRDAQQEDDEDDDVS